MAIQEMRVTETVMPEVREEASEPDGPGFVHGFLLALPLACLLWFGIILFLRAMLG